MGVWSLLIEHVDFEMDSNFKNCGGKFHSHKIFRARCHLSISYDCRTLFSETHGLNIL